MRHGPAHRHRAKNEGRHPRRRSSATRSPLASGASAPPSPPASTSPPRERRSASPPKSPAATASRAPPGAPTSAPPWPCSEPGWTAASPTSSACPNEPSRASPPSRARSPHPSWRSPNHSPAAYAQQPACPSIRGLPRTRPGHRPDRTHPLRTRGFCGARSVMACGLPARLDPALALGAEVTTASQGDDLVRRGRDVDGRAGADVVIIAVGAPTSSPSPPSARPSVEHLLLRRLPRRRTDPDRPKPVHYRELTICGSANATLDDYAAAVTALSSGRTDLSATHHTRICARRGGDALDAVQSTRRTEGRRAPGATLARSDSSSSPRRSATLRRRARPGPAHHRRNERRLRS